MSDVTSAGAVATAKSWSEYDLMMQFSNELERRTSEVLALEDRNARLMESLQHAEKGAREARAMLEAVLNADAGSPDLSKPSSEPANESSLKTVVEAVIEKPAEPASEVAMPIEEPADLDIDECPDYKPHRGGFLLKVLKGLGLGSAVVAVGAAASVVTVSLLYDMELVAAANTISEGIATLLS